MTIARLAIAIVLCVLAADSADARDRGSPYNYNQPKGGCGHFGWAVARELDLFAKAEKPSVDSGTRLPALPDKAVMLELDSDADATRVMPMEKKSRSENGYGGSVAFADVPRAGMYQISLSEDALVDIIQDGKYLPKKASRMRRDCPGLRRSIRVQLSAGPLLLQFGGVEMPYLAIAAVPAD